MNRIIISVMAMFGTVVTAHAKCDAMATAPWTSAKSFELKLEAHAIGPDCANSAIVLLVINSNAVVQYSTTRLSQYNLMFQGNFKDNASMKAALVEWLDQGLTTKPNVGSDLPEWKAGKEQAERDGDGEFGFFAAPEMSREYYLDVRKQKKPLFCFVQGLESTSCIAASGPDSITEIGGFSFPG